MVTIWPGHSCRAAAQVASPRSTGRLETLRPNLLTYEKRNDRAFGRRHRLQATAWPHHAGHRSQSMRGQGSVRGRLSVSRLRTCRATENGAHRAHAAGQAQRGRTWVAASSARECCRLPRLRVVRIGVPGEGNHAGSRLKVSGPLAVRRYAFQQRTQLIPGECIGGRTRARERLPRIEPQPQTFGDELELRLTRSGEQRLELLVRRSLAAA